MIQIIIKLSPLSGGDPHHRFQSRKNCRLCWTFSILSLIWAEIDLEFIHKIDKLSINDITNWANYRVT